MPIPRPNKGEEQPNFMHRCMGDEVMNKDYPDNKQRVAICISSWRKSKASELTEEEIKALGLAKDEKVDKI